MTVQPSVELQPSNARPAPPPPDPAQENDMLKALLTHTPATAATRAATIQLERTLRAMRAEIQDLQELLARIRRGELAIAIYAPYIKQTMGTIRTLLRTLPAREETDHRGDMIRHIRNVLEQMQCNPLLLEPTKDLSAEDTVHHLTLLDEQFNRLVFYIGVITIPSRVSEWLEQARPGYYLPFHAIFSDELPSPEDRIKVLNYLAWAPRVVRGGLVDPASGLIYRYSTSPLWIAASILLLIGALLLSGLIVWLSRSFVPVFSSATPPSDPPLVLWLAVVIGTIFHVVVTTTKQQRAQPDQPPILALGTVPQIINAHIGRVLFKLLMTLFGFFGLAFAGGATNVTLLNAFLIGYSLDSVVDLFGASAEQRATSYINTVRQQLGLNT